MAGDTRLTWKACSYSTSLCEADAWLAFRIKDVTIEIHYIETRSAANFDHLNPDIVRGEATDKFQFFQCVRRLSLVELAWKFHINAIVTQTKLRLVLYMLYKVLTQILTCRIQWLRLVTTVFTQREHARCQAGKKHVQATPEPRLIYR